MASTGIISETFWYIVLLVDVSWSLFNLNHPSEGHFITRFYELLLVTWYYNVPGSLCAANLRGPNIPDLSPTVSIGPIYCQIIKTVFGHQGTGLARIVQREY